MDYKRLSVGDRCFAAVFLFFGGDYRLSESVPVGHWAVLHHFADLRLVRFILDADDCTYLSGIQCVGHHKCEYGAVALRISEKPDWAGNGNQCDGSGDIGGPAGPSVASGILSIASWHWLFAINVPLGITALLLGIKHLPRQEERSKRKFDFVSAIANAVTFGLLIYTLDGFAHHEEMDFLVLQLIILAIVGTFYVRRQLTQTTPLLPLDLLRIPIFRLSILTSICSFIAQMAAMVSLPFFLQNTLGHSEVMTGLLLTPWPLATLVTAPLAGYLVERIHPGILGSIGMALFAVGLFSLSGLTAESSDISIILRLMLCGAGFGLFQTPNNSTIISSAPTKRSGGASGMLGMARLLGQTFGTTLVALLFSFVVHDRSTAVCLMVGSGFAVVAAIVSSLRLSQPSTLKRETNQS